MLGRTNAVIGSSGGGGTSGEFLCTVVDYDGTILKQEYHNANEYFEIPSQAPTHEGLTFEGWQCALEITNNKVLVTDQDVTVGPLYYATSGFLEVDVKVTDNYTVTFSSSYTGTKDWGDGTVDTEVSHTYTTGGNYTILIKDNLPNYMDNLIDTSSERAIILRARVPYDITRPVFDGCINLESVNTHSKEDPSIGYYILRNCYKIKAYIISSSTTYGASTSTSFTSSDFEYCFNLKYVVLPNRKLTVNYDSAFSNSGLESFTFPKNVSITYKTNTFLSGTNIKKILLPSNLSFTGSNYSSICSNCRFLEKATIECSTIPSSCFYGCYGLKTVICKNVTLIKGSAFSNCYNVEVYDFTGCSSVPTLDNASAFTGINPLARILVPLSLVDAWKGETNWSTYASNIVGV